VLNAELYGIVRPLARQHGDLAHSSFSFFLSLSLEWRGAGTVTSL
jgi:hypothetical protein